jgi:hypothetical protein
MKDIIYLESDEEISSIIEKIKAAKADELGLVVPKGATFVQSVVNLKLVQEVCKKAGKKIALITSDRVGRNLASQIGIAVYDSVRSEKPSPPDIREAPPQPSADVYEVDLSPKERAELPRGVSVHTYATPDGHAPQPEAIKHSWFGKRTQSQHEILPPARVLEIVDEEIPPNSSAGEADEKHSERQSHVARHHMWPTLAKIFGILAVAVGIFLISFGLTFLRARAEVTVFVKADPLKADVKIAATTDENPGEGEFAATLVETRERGSKKVGTTGKKNVGEKAKGNVTLLNEWTTDSVKVGAGTALTAEGKSFKTTGDVIIPGAGVELKDGKVVTIAGKTTTSVEAAEPGGEYNLAPTKLAFSAYTGEKQQKIYAQSSQAFAGGFSKEISIVSEQDLTNTTNALLEELAQKANQALKEKAPKLTILEESVQFPDKVFTPSVQVEQEATEFTLEGDVAAYALAFELDAYQASSRKAASIQLPSGKGILPTKSDIFRPTVDVGASSKERLILNVHFEGTVVSAINEQQLKAALAGRQPSELPSIVQSLGATRVETFLTPRWVKTIPTKLERIEISIQPEQ